MGSLGIHGRTFSFPPLFFKVCDSPFRTVGGGRASRNPVQENGNGKKSKDSKYKTAGSSAQDMVVFARRLLLRSQGSGCLSVLGFTRGVSLNELWGFVLPPAPHTQTDHTVKPVYVLRHA